MCQHHFQPRENELCHVLCSSCPYFELGAARTVPNSHVIVFCSTPLVFSKFGVLRTVNGAAPSMSNLRRLRRASITRSLTLGKCRNAYGIAENRNFSFVLDLCSRRSGDFLTNVVLLN